MPKQEKSLHAAGIWLLLDQAGLLGQGVDAAEAEEGDEGPDDAPRGLGILAGHLQVADGALRHLCGRRGVRHGALSVGLRPLVELLKVELCFISGWWPGLGGLGCCVVHSLQLSCGCGDAGRAEGCGRCQGNDRDECVSW